MTADIILMDEWIAAGDEAFIKKASVRLQMLIDRADIMLSHRTIAPLYSVFALGGCY